MLLSPEIDQLNFNDDEMQDVDEIIKLPGTKIQAQSRNINIPNSSISNHKVSFSTQQAFLAPTSSFQSQFLHRAKESNFDKEAVSRLIQRDVEVISTQLYQLQNKVINLIQTDPITLSNLLKAKNQKHIQNMIELAVVTQRVVQRVAEDETEVSSEDEEMVFNTNISKEEVLKTVRNTSRFLINNIQDSKIIAKGLIRDQLCLMQSRNGIRSTTSLMMTQNQKKQISRNQPQIFAAKTNPDSIFQSNNSPNKVQSVRNLIIERRIIKQRIINEWKSEGIEKCVNLKKSKVDYDPMIVEEVYQGPSVQRDIQIVKPSSKKLNGLHLVVFVHGYQASGLDMRIFKNYVQLNNPKVVCFSSQSNEEQTEGCIDQMGKNLAKEVKKYVIEYCYAKDQTVLFLHKLSFVGHSLGGVIIRAALPYLEDFKGIMEGYMSLGSPHLGYLPNQHSLVSAGLWVLKSFKQSECLKQLSMTEQSNIKQSFLYRLSKAPGLDWFKQVFICASSQDNYVPYDSARIQIPTQINENSQITQKMVQNMMKKLTKAKIVKIDANFKIDERSIDTFIGRTAHIQLVECETFIQLIVEKYSQFFTD